MIRRLPELEKKRRLLYNYIILYSSSHETYAVCLVAPHGHRGRTRLNIVNGILGIIGQKPKKNWSIIPRIPLTMFSRVLSILAFGAEWRLGFHAE